jgi:hypothetical protein
VSLLVLLLVAGLGAGMFAMPGRDAAEPESVDAVAEHEPKEPATAVEGVASAPAWTGREPLGCRGTERHELRGAKISSDGELLRASGSCAIELIDCTIAQGSTC